MLFNSFEFIFLFLPITFVVYFFLNQFSNQQYAIYCLVLSSLFFYGYFKLTYLAIITVSIIVNFALSRIINNSNHRLRKTYMIIGVVFNVLILCYYKYTDFFITNINSLFDTDFAMLHLLLPLGLSFITFQQIAFIVDSYRDGTAHYKFSNYALFILFFPQLVAGPIVQHDEMLPQYDIKENRKIIHDNVARGLFIFVIGLVKKIVIADTVGIWANAGFENYSNLSFVEAWITSLSYTVQLYYDFSGYSDMAIGLALLFNIKLPVNFFSPYKARNIQEFWKKWHMTLNRFLTTYVYFPLGGSRKGEFRTYINILIIFFISGFWHGAGWNFILWGLMHGFASVVVRLFSKTGVKLPYLLSWFITFQFVNIAWVYFRATSLEQANTIISKMFTPNMESITSFFTEPLTNFAQAEAFSVMGLTLSDPIVIVVGLLITLVFAFTALNSIQLMDKMKFNWGAIIYMQCMIALVLISIYYMQKNSIFLYFNF
ncbi:MBOAT family O-acyltransferase [Lysinibacillus sphaericus]|uniref:MBOAT family O-acyltransferase n=1 Tax=Lysinibacillus sphaericus TaxID=1421 RepID=UPI001CBFBC2F|nr:MBOAT family O-acyltransferase [Lysinibacillus sphaericus]